MLPLLLALAPSASARPLSECPQTWDQSGLLDVVQSADLSVSRLDQPGYLAARDLLLVRLECVSEPLSGQAIGAVHRVMATAASIEGKDARVAPSLAGLLAADPGYQLPLALYPEGHPVRGLLSHAALLVRDPSTRPLATLPSGWIEVDGLHADAAPSARASVLQQIDGQGQVVETRYVWPDDDLGAWAGTAALAATSRASLPAAPRARSHAARAPLLVATGVSAVATGVLYGLARANHDDFYDESVDREEGELLALQKTTNTLTIGWSAAGIATLGLGVGLVVAW